MRRRPNPREDAKIRGLAVMVAVEGAEEHAQLKDSRQLFLRYRKEVSVSGGNSELPSSVCRKA